MKKKIIASLSFINVARKVADHLLGKHHTAKHRKYIGGIMMLFGVGLVKVLGVFDSHILHFFSDVVGYALHGIGLIPFISDFEKCVKD